MSALAAVGLVARLALSSAAGATTGQDTTIALMPQPATITTGAGAATIDQALRVSSARTPDARLGRGVVRFLGHLEHATGFAFAGEISPDTNAVHDVPIVVTTIVLDVKSPGAALDSLGEDESYALDVVPDEPAAHRGGTIHLRAATTVGALRGLETLLQLVSARDGSFVFREAHVVDAPRFAWRGLLVDVSRHFEPLGEIERTLDAMAAVKLNVLHLHLSDDQGIRVESARFPAIQRKASDSLFYTRDQIRRLVRYAQDRGIRIVPEFDMPGHSTAWLAAFPKLASDTGYYGIGRSWSGFRGTMDPTRESTFNFIDAFVGDMTKLFPDAYWHVGGDEVVGYQWNNSPRVVAFKKARGFKDNDALQAYFNRRVSQILTTHRRRMVGWDETLHPDLPKSAIVQSWRGTKYLAQAAAQGHRGILSAPYYLDAMRSAETIYLADPLAVGDTSLTGANAASVLGGEAAMWAELVWPESIESRLWPRTAALAERFWSPTGVRDVSDMYRRLWLENVRLEALGLDQISHSDRVLRGVVQGPAWVTVRPFMDAVEPATLGQRLRFRRNVQMTPLVQLADAAVPDPPLRWKMQRWVSALGDTTAARANTSAADSLRALFDGWVGMPSRLRPLYDSAPLLRDADRAALAMSRAGEIGRTALDARIHGTVLGATWADSARVTLKALDGAQGPLHVVGIPAIARLLDSP